jgi:hypothetical protein
LAEGGVDYPESFPSVRFVAEGLGGLVALEAD